MSLLKHDGKDSKRILKQIQITYRNLDRLFCLLTEADTVDGISPDVHEELIERIDAIFDVIFDAMASSILR